MDTISIYVATHKKMNYVLPPIYKLCQVNAAITGRWDNYFHDDDHENNISRKNNCYCELTAQYELWKNNNSRIKGLAHYRRFFSNIDVPSYNQFINNRIPSCNIGQSIITEGQIRTYLNNYDIILQWPINSFHTSAYENLTKHVFPKDIEVLISVIEEDFPEYIECLESVLSRTGISYLNMLIANDEIFDQYSSWLFDVLERVENRIDISNYDIQHKRIYGYLSEVLLNVYVDYHNLKVKNVYMTELLETPAKLTGMAMVKEKFFPKFVIPLWNRIRTDNHKKYIYLIQLATEKTKDKMIADYYINCRSFSDVYRMMKTYKDFDTSIQKITIDNILVSYIETVTRGTSRQGINRGISIVHIFYDVDNNIESIISKLYDMYSKNYILDIRVITTDNKLLDIRDRSGKRCQIINI